jgi:peptide-methionine (R)-S-oxide reductase
MQDTIRHTPYEALDDKLANRHTPASPGRRGFLSASGLALAALALGCSRESSAAPATRRNLPKTVEIAEFSNDGKRLRVAELPSVVKSDAEWRQQLSPLAYRVTRQDGTEIAFTGALLKNKERGVYRCVCCDTALFDSRTKYESGTGWPSFYRPIARHNIFEETDRSLGMVRTEVSCARCDAHLGHVFNDGPPPTGLRYCMNSVSLTFAKAS